MSASAKLTPGYGFHLEPNGQWKVRAIPEDVVDNAVESGHLTIQGFRSTVFEAPDGDQWAQKTTVTASSIWTRPLLDDELAELERFSDSEKLDPIELKQKFSEAKLRTLRDFDWARLEGTESYQIGSLDAARADAERNDRDVESILEALGSGQSMPAPVVLERSDGSIVLVDGNARLVASRALNLYPQVLWVTMKSPTASIASRVAYRWIAAAGRRDFTSLKKNLSKDKLAEWNKASIKYLDKVREYGEGSGKDFTSCFRQIEKICAKAPKASHDRVAGHEEAQIRDIYATFVTDVNNAYQKMLARLQTKMTELQTEAEEGIGE